MKTAWWLSLVMLGACAHARAPSGPPQHLTQGKFGDVPAGTEQPVWFVYTSVDFARHRLGDAPVDRCLQQAKDDPRVSNCWFVLDPCTTLELDLGLGLARLDVYAVNSTVPFSSPGGAGAATCGVAQSDPTVGRELVEHTP
jgi:hypothetical protein